MHILKKIIFALLLPILPCAGQSAAMPLTIEPQTVIDRSLTIENLVIRQPRPLKVALVLSGGSARGFAHVGVLRAIEEKNIPVHLIVGTSIGAIVGGFYAVGYSSAQIEQRLMDTDWTGIFANQAVRSQQFVSQKSQPRRHLVQLRLNGFLPTIPSSISQGQQIFQSLYNSFLQANFHAAGSFDDLKIPFRAVATDLISGEKVVLRDGDLAEAINASMAFPLLFAPVEIDNRLLVDGGITDNLPVSVAILENAELVIAVDATSPLRAREGVAAPWEIADQVTSIMMSERTDQSRRQADFLIRPQLNNVPGFNVSSIDSLIESGYRETLLLSDSILQWYQAERMARQDGQLTWQQVTAIHCRVNGAPAPAAFAEVMFPLLGKTLRKSDIITKIEDLYGRGDVASAVAVIDSSAGGNVLNVNIEQFPKIDDVRFLSADFIPDSLFDNFRTQVAGRPLNTGVLKQQLILIQKWLTSEDYALATIGPIRLTPGEQGSSLEINVQPGVISEIDVHGNHHTRKFVIEREFPLKKDSLFQSPLAIDGIRNIYSTGLFDRVLINLDRQAQGNQITIKVKERQTLLARMGAHFSLERQTDGFVELSEENLFGSAIEVSATGMVGGLIRRTDVRISTPRVFRTLLTAELHQWYQERRDRYYSDFERIADYNSKRSGVRFLFGQQIERLGLISGEIKVENIDVVSGDEEFPFNEDLRLRSLTIRSVVDKRDRLPFPQKGIYNRWYWEIGNQTVLGGNARFTKVFLGLEGYYPWFSWLNYHPFVYAGSADLTLPFSEFFRLGGDQNFRGLHEAELQGRQFLNVGVDLRMRVPMPLETYLAARYQTGAVWVRPDDRISYQDFLHSLSTQLAVNSPIGPARLTFSHIPDGRSRIDFSLGFDF